MQKKFSFILAILLTATFVTPSAYAFTKAEMNFLKGVKLSKIATLKKNTDKELLAIGRTACGDTYYAGTMKKIYAQNHYKWNAASEKAITTQARKFLCAKKITIVWDNGEVTTGTIYDENTKVIDAGTVYSSGTQTESKIQNAQKQPPRPSNTLSVEVLNIKTVNNSWIELGDQYFCLLNTSFSNSITTYSWYYTFPLSISGEPAVEIPNQKTSLITVTQDMLNYLSKSQELDRSIFCKATVKTPQSEVVLLEKPKIGSSVLTAR